MRATDSTGWQPCDPPRPGTPRLLAAALAAVLLAGGAGSGSGGAGLPADPWRPAYHFTPPAGWMNDPNGLVQYRGLHHLFYQYHPFGVDWGPMHWGHAVSGDLVRWRHLPIALVPDPQGPDVGGCFSGSAVVDDDVLSLVYTCQGESVEVQCLATSGDGRVFEKYAHNPVIAAPPPGYPAKDFRDPKVFSHRDGWRVVLGTEKDGKGRVLLYESPDLRAWQFVSEVAASDGRLGGMWECPDLFPLGERHVLLVSTTSDRKVMALVGTLGADGRLADVSDSPADWGADYYAAQSYADDSGRRVVIGWMESWARKEWPTKAYGWAGAMALPRTVRLETDGSVTWSPVAEVESLRGTLVDLRPHPLPVGRHVVPGVEGDALEIEAVLEPGGASEVALCVRASKDGAEETRIVYDRPRSVLAIDRSRAGAGDGGVHEAPFALGSDGRLRLRVFVDRSSVEVFASGGRVVLTDRVFPAPTSRRVALEAKGGAARVVSLRAWPLADVATAW